MHYEVHYTAGWRNCGPQKVYYEVHYTKILKTEEIVGQNAHNMENKGPIGNKRGATEMECAGCGGSFQRISAHLARRPKCMVAFRDQQKGTGGPDPTGAAAGAAAEESTTFKEVMRSSVVSELGDIRYGSGLVSGSAVDQFKMTATGWLQSCERSLVQALQPHINPASGIDVAELVRSRLDIFNGVTTAKLEQSRYVQSVLGGRHVAPVRRVMPGQQTDCVWDFPLEEQLQALIKHDYGAAHQIKESAFRWSAAGAAAAATRDGVTLNKLSDITDGNIFKTHPMLGTTSRPILCTISGGDAIKTAWKAYYDDVEVANPLGVARGVHALGALYVSLINLCPETRNRLEYTFLVTLAKTSVIKKYGMTVILSGADSSGNVSGTDFSLGAQMRRFNSGVGLEFPSNGPFGGLERRMTFGWLVLMSGDFPAMAKVLCTAQSTAGKKPCRGCNWERESDAAFRESSFLRCRPCASLWTLRDMDSTQALIDEASLIRAVGARKSKMAAEGIYSTDFALHSTYFPFLVNPFACTPQDGMHALFSSGIATSEAAEMLYIFLSVHRDFTLDALNDRIEEFDWPPGEKPPPIHESVRSGATGGVPSHGCHLRYTGSQTMHFTLASLELLQPLVTTTSCPAWASWQALVEVVQRYTAREFTYESVRELDKAISTHLRLYQRVPQYSGRLRPKHHFLTHTAMDILNFGPPRQFWCFGYEAKNQAVKRAANASNFRDVVKSAAKTLAMQAAKSILDRNSGS